MDIVVNLSNRKLTLSETSVLNKGLNFCIANKNFTLPLDTYHKEIDRFIRNLQIKYYFRDEPNDTVAKFRGNPEWEVPAHRRHSLIDGYRDVLKTEFKKLFNKNKIRNNLSPNEVKALESLQKDDSIIIFKADKGGSIVVMNRSDYKEKITTMLNDPVTYTVTNAIDLVTATKEVDCVLDTLLTGGYILRAQNKFLKRCKAKIPNLYGLPKVHKKDIPLRPIVSQISSPAYNLNKYLDYLLTTAEKGIPNLLQDTTHFLRIINDVSINKDDALLYTIDVTSLYTVLPHKMILDYVEEMYQETLLNWCTPDINPIPKELLREILSVILKQTFFQFHDKLYNQNFGITMGAPSSVKLANITLHKHMVKITETYRNKGKLPAIQLRFIDDIFGVFQGTKEEVMNWYNHLNESHDSIKFTIEISDTIIPFLDTSVYIENNKLLTKLYKKPTDNKQYLHFDSEHVNHVKKGIPYAQAIRYKRIIVDQNILHEEMASLRSRFISRGYPVDIVDPGLKRARDLNRLDLLKYKDKNHTPWKVTPFIITYSNAFVSRKDFNIHSSLNVSWSKLVQNDPSLSQLYPPKVIFKKGTSLNRVLVSSVFPPKKFRLRRPISSYRNVPLLVNHNPTSLNWLSAAQSHLSRVTKCNSIRCQTCPFISTLSTYTSTITKKMYAIKQTMCCDAKNVIYLISCKKCGIQYVGETGRVLRKRVADHKSAIRTHNPHSPIAIHFNSLNHNMQDLTIIPLEYLKTDAKNVRLGREVFYQLLLHTVFPEGLNCFPTRKSNIYKDINITSPDTLINFHKSLPAHIHTA